MEAIDEISAIGKSPRSNGSNEKPLELGKLKVDMKKAANKANQSVIINDVMSNFSDAPLSPLFEPVRTSKRFLNINRDFNFTPSEMSSGRKLMKTPKTPKNKFNKLEALRTPVLVKK